MGNERIRLTALIALFAVSLLGMRVVAHVRPAAQSTAPDWNAVPHRLGSWIGSDGKFDPIYGTDPADTSLLRVYSRGGRVSRNYVYAGFYSDLSAILKSIAPRFAIPRRAGQSYPWERIRPGTIAGRLMSASRMPWWIRPATSAWLGWWYNAGAKPSETRIRDVWAMIALSIVTGRKDGSLVRFETAVYAGRRSFRRAPEFWNSRKFSLPVLDKALPR